MLSHGKANLGRMKRYTWMSAGPQARQHADEPQEGEEGQSADSEASLLPHTVHFTPGCYF